MSDIEKYFATFRSNIIGIDSVYQSPYGPQKIVYGDWQEDFLVVEPGQMIQPTHNDEVVKAE